MSDFHEKFQSMTEFVGGAAKSIMGRLDQFTFKILVDGLKADDYEAVVGTIEQLEKEKKPLSIPPLYFVSKAHPNNLLRQRAEKALANVGNIKEIEKLTDGKSTEDAVKVLIE
ncbi:MAG: hypothetical protein K8F91_16010, partial [Candidatus Obscuribacterales bacterium]|nr:hypothetical protein [Candidatus Obscuribacterales bacterium]